MIKNASTNNFLIFAFDKYCLYNKHRKRRVHCMSLVVFFITYNIQLGNKKQETLNESNLGVIHI